MIFGDALPQARLSFTHIGGPQPGGRRGAMDAGDADGADALLSLAKLANAESSAGIIDIEGEDVLHDSYADHLDTPFLVNRPRRSAKPPPKADVSPVDMPGIFEANTDIRLPLYHAGET